jgi:hypothetical protein
MLAHSNTREGGMLVVEFLAGAALLALGTYVFWRIGRPDGVNPRLRRIPGLESLVVLVVLSGWAGGASLVVHSVAAIAAP